MTNTTTSSEKIMAYSMSPRLAGSRRRRSSKKSKKGCGCPAGARKVKGGGCHNGRKFVRKVCR